MKELDEAFDDGNHRIASRHGWGTVAAVLLRTFAEGDYCDVPPIPLMKIAEN
jgi:hypothetical protein